MTETKTKKAPLSRLACALLALVMAIGICVPTAAFAADYSITITNASSGETYSAYKIFDVTYSNENYSYTIDSNSAWFSTVSDASDVFTLTEIGSSGVYNVTVNEGVEDDDITAVFVAAGVPASILEHPDGYVVAGDFGFDTDGSSKTGSATIDLNEAGYYFVTTTLGSVVSINTTDPDAEITDKNPVPTLDKKVKDTDGGTIEDTGTTDGTEDNAKVGDILEFEIDITNAAHKSALCLHDYVTDGLTFYGDTTIHVYLNNYDTPVADTNYTISDEATCGYDCIFEITFDPDWLDNLSDSDTIIVTYKAVVNEEAVVVNNNDAFLTYGTGGRSVTTETETDVYGFNLVKTDSSGAQIDGATFTLSYSDGKLIDFVKNDTTYTVHDAIDDKYAEETTTTEIEVGSASIFGLEAGTYTLTETKAPAGYNQLTYDITVTIAEDGTVSISGGDNSSVNTDGTITVVNNTGTVLPGTGGMGTTIFYIIGGILVVGAVVVLITRRRMNNRA